MRKKLSVAQFALSAVCCLLLAGSAAAQQQDDGLGAGEQETLQDSTANSPPANDQLQTSVQGETATVNETQQALPGDAAAMQQNLRFQLQNTLGLTAAQSQDDQKGKTGGIQIDAAIASLKIDPAVQAAIHEKMLKIMQQTMQETFADPKMRQEMQQNFLFNGIAPGASGEVKK
ncbi:MAG: hypothetical protein CDV28_101205 [Candidatus Electronema aureum]|uniref:Uncharacterized protein n=1 Tax=Candidatus Electronema aureum TaxID=2005002 RepID=A0A521G5K9_9BACT|nr:MAG: hypothetical protein CDV28_101205 [Candidatus Electronema aureum]